MSEKLDILYICPPSGRQKDFELSIGIAYLQAYLKSKGFTSKQYIPVSLNIDEMIEEIISYETKVIGFSTYDMNYYYVKLLVKKLKEKKPEITIIIGGPTATFSTEIIFNDLGHLVDYIIRGYGEISTHKLLELILNKKGNKNQIKGLSYLNEELIINNELELLPQNIDLFPSPYLSDINFFPERKIVFTSRGCIHDCVYCNCPLICNKKIYYHSVDRIIEELKYISKKDPGCYVLLGDDAFTLNIERAKTICEKIIKENINLNLFCETRADRIDEDLLVLLKKAGFVKIDFGLESASPKILRNVKKVFHPLNDLTFETERKFLEKMKKIVKQAQELNLDPMVNIITGLPGEKKEEALETINYIKELNLNSYSHNYLKIYSGTEIMKDYEKWGYTLKRDAFILPVNIGYSYDVNEIMPFNNSVSRSEIVRLKKEFINVYFNNEYIDFSRLEISSLLNVNLNQEIFVYVTEEKQMDQFANIVVDNLIPTNNINYILESEDCFKIFNCFDRQNYILVTKVKNENFNIPNKYYELLFVENLTKNIKKRFAELKVNPFLNRFVILNKEENLNTEVKLNQIIEDYLETYESTKKEEYYLIINKFIKYFNYEIDNLNMFDFRKCLEKKIISIEELKVIKRFLSYYLLGVVTNE